MNIKKMALALSCVFAAACSTSGPPKTENGPVIMNVRTNPEVVKMDRDFRPTSPAEILVEVKDYRSTIDEVRLNFGKVPLEIPMEHLSGTTWRATFTPEQLKKLAIGDQTTKYDIHLTARSRSGETKTVTDAGTIKIKGPDLSRKF